VSTWFVGGYTSDMGGDATGIAVLTSRADGSLESVGVAASSASPSYLLVTESTVFAVGEGAGSVSAFSRTGVTGLTEQTVASAGGAAPCHLALYGDSLVVACYVDGNLTTFDRESLMARGALTASGSGPRAEQDGPHAHSSARLADGRIVSADLGADRIHVHSLVDGLLVRESSFELPSGTGPRDLHVLSNGLILILAEFGLEILVLHVAADGALSLQSRVPLPGAHTGDQAAALAITDDERFVYSGLRGSNRVAALALTIGNESAEAASVIISAVGYVSAEGDWPRHLTVDGNIVHVANQRSSSVASFRIGDSGLPTLIAEPTTVATPTVLAKA
jgi:6-phosphogluconolactonase